MKRSLLWFWMLFSLIALVILNACTSSSAPPASPIPANQPTKVTLDPATIVTGQTVYVPVYSHIFTWERSRTMNLTATLSVRNTDLDNSIIVTVVDYYDTNGILVRKYLEQPIELKPLASTNYVVNQEDVSGGVGASFVVEWGAQQAISNPVIEAIMINAGGNQGVSFVSTGRVIKTLEK